MLKYGIYFCVGVIVLKLLVVNPTPVLAGARTTRVRDNSGRLHILRNGQIGDVINYSKNYTHAVVEVGVAYESDLDKVLSVLEAVGERLHESREDVLEPTMIKGLGAFGESEMVVRTVSRFLTPAAC